MKLATPAHLRKVTGSTDPTQQYRMLREQLGIRPILADGQVRVYEEVIAQAMQGGAEVRVKPAMNMEAFDGA